MSGTRGLWAASSPRCGGELVGYWLPTKFAGPTNSALALINFPSLAAYEQYRERLAKDNDNLSHLSYLSGVGETYASSHASRLREGFERRYENLCRTEFDVPARRP